MKTTTLLNNSITRDSTPSAKLLDKVTNAFAREARETKIMSFLIRKLGSGVVAWLMAQEVTRWVSDATAIAIIAVPALSFYLAVWGAGKCNLRQRRDYWIRTLKSSSETDAERFAEETKKYG